MNAAHPRRGQPIVDLVPIVRRVVASRLPDAALSDDSIQETLGRVMASWSRIESDTLVPYAIATARNLIASAAQGEQRARRKAYLFAESDGLEQHPDEQFLRREGAEAALTRLSPAERQILVAHEVEGSDTATPAAGTRSQPAELDE